MKRTVPWWLAAVSLLFALAVPAAARTRPRYGGILHMDTRSDPLKFPDGAARRLLFDTLTQVSDAGEIVPALAVELGVAECKSSLDTSSAERRSLPRRLAVNC